MITTIITVVVVFGLVLMKTIMNLLYICNPNEVLIFSGSGRWVGKKRVGYKIVKGGRAWRTPLFEVVDKMDLSNMAIDVEIKGAYSKGGIPLTVAGVANVKVAGESPALDNALQRFLGKNRAEIAEVAKETLEGNLRGVLATMTPEEFNQDKEKFARALQEEAEQGLHRLGLTLDSLKIQNVSDDVGYLDSIGRRQSAEIVKKARMSEASNKSQSAIQQAENRRQAELVRLEQEIQVARAESDRRTRNAETAQQALVAEQQGEVQALVARARAELNLQEARLQQVKSKLEAEVIQPARAQMEADIAKARGDAARILENGRASADALKNLATQWKRLGPNAKDVFLLQKLDAILPIYLSSIRNVRIDKIAMVQNTGDGSSTATSLVAGLEQLKAGAGIDVAQLLSRLGGKHDRPMAEPPSGSPPPPPPITPPGGTTRRGK